MGYNASVGSACIAGRFRSTYTALILCVLALTLALPLHAFAGSRTIWQSKEQFVKIVTQDGNASSTPPNNHPAELTEDQVRNALSSMVLAPNEKQKQLPVFNEDEVDALSKYIPEALHQAGPREDVTFAIIGHFSLLVDFLKVRKVTTGRVFYQDGKLNIIFGMIHNDFKDNEDRRLAPFTPGSRTRPAELEDLIMALPGQQPFTKPRGDWVIFSQEGLNTPPPVVIAPARPEQRRREQFEQRPTEVYTPQQEAPKPAAVPWGQNKSPEERLTHLNELKNKHLITDEEFRAKKMEILNGL